MHSVRSGGEGHVEPVVHEEEGSGVVYDRKQPLGHLPHLARRGPLGPQLYRGGSGGEGVPDHVLDTAGSGEAFVRDDHQSKASSEVGVVHAVSMLDWEVGGDARLTRCTRLGPVRQSQVLGAIRGVPLPACDFAGPIVLFQAVREEMAAIRPGHEVEVGIVGGVEGRLDRLLARGSDGPGR